MNLNINCKNFNLKWYWNENNYRPCQGMPRIDFTYADKIPPLKGMFIVTIAYPQEIKVITQSRAVDGNALIGNIGGYIGLFLGSIYSQLFPKLIV